MTRQKIDPERAEKACSFCKVMKPRDAFSKNRSNRDGLNSVCSSCDQVISSCGQLMIRLEYSKEELLKEAERHQKLAARAQRLADGMTPREAARLELGLEQAVTAE